MYVFCDAVLCVVVCLLCCVACNSDFVLSCFCLLCCDERCVVLVVIAYVFCPCVCVLCCVACNSVCFVVVLSLVL